MDETLELAEQSPRSILDPEQVREELTRLRDRDLPMSDKLAILGDWRDASPCAEARSALLEVVTAEEDCELVHDEELRLAAAEALSDFLPEALVPVVEFLGVCGFYADDVAEDDPVLSCLEDVAHRGVRPLRSLDSFGLVHQVSEILLGRIPEDDEVLEGEEMWQVQSLCSYLRVGSHGYYVDGPPPRSLAELVRELDRRE